MHIFFLKNKQTNENEKHTQFSLLSSDREGYNKFGHTMHNQA